MPHIFISYAKKDTRDLAIALHDALNALNGVTAWVDKTMRAGRSWELQIETEIDKCDFMIVLYSDDLHRHKRGEPESYVLTEIAYAKYTAKKPIIPVMAQPTTAPMSLTMEHYIDFIGQGMTIEALVEALCYEMNITPANAPTSTSEPVRTTFLSPTPEPAIETPPQKIITSTRKSSLELLPKPFAYIPIPEGKVTIEKGGYLDKDTTFIVPAFEMAKYPITNAQFKLFMDAGGYHEKRWWTDDGWAQRQQKNWIQPRYWYDSPWNGADYPVVGVSWYEAVAFCLWLSETTGENIMLPTVQQWQRAAQGDDGREYPWGNDWDASRCNNNVDKKGIGTTTPVRQYESNGDSPFGVTDMTGNVSEWLLTADYTGQTNLLRNDARMLGGGSCYDSEPDDFYAVVGSSVNASYVHYSWGFRIARLR